jgi:enediyne biosynthesis protein E4
MSTQCPRGCVKASQSRRKRPIEALFLAAALAAGAVIVLVAQPAREPITIRVVPPDLGDTAWLETMAAAQQKDVGATTLAHDFRFTDRRVESGITFRHRIVDDAGKTYKPAHYDHGNGIAIADVDGDGLSDIYFVNQVGGNQLWKNRGDGRFDDVTGTAGVAVADAVSVGASFADIDNDGDPDLLVTTVRAGNHLFENVGGGRFRDISEAAGVAYRGHSSAAVFFDYDRDGLLDLFVVNVGRYTTDVVGGDPPGYHVAYADAFSGHLKPERAERSILYHNQGNRRFVDVTERTGLVDLSWSGDASPIDGNDDGWPDLYVLNMLGDDEYYENVRGQRFVKRSRDVFPRTSWGSMGVKVFDVNRDGRLDLLVTDMHSDMSDKTPPDEEAFKSDMKWPESFRGTGATSIWGNSLFLKDGPGAYREASDALGAENYCPWGPSVGDLNADGFDDVFIASGMNFPDRYMVNAVKLNDAGKRLVDAAFVLGVEPRAGGVAAPWFELDAAGKDKDHPGAVGATTSRVAVVAARASRSAVVFDLDRDGDLDIVTNEFNTAPMVLVSDLAQRTTVHRVEIALQGRKSNRDALGAVITVIAGGASQTKVMDGASGYLSHSVAPLYFGLGAASRIDRIDVRWPSGTTQQLRAPTIVNSRLTIVER